MENLSTKIHKKPIRPIHIIQFGEGNFLRAFIDWQIQKMNDAGTMVGDVVVVQPVSSGRVADLAAQDGLYTLYLQGKMDGNVIRSHEIIDVIGDVINPFEDYAKYLKYAENIDLKLVISNTTEAGIALDETDLDFTNTPKSYPGKLLAFLKHRYDYFNGSKDAGMWIMPCELIDYNGDNLKKVMIELAKIHHFDAKFIDWLENANKYYNTLVDRIVPGYPRDEIKEITAELGYIDSSIVKGEIFHLFCIQGDESIKKWFPFDKTNLHVILTPSIKPYKERKVKILNGSHTAMVPVSYLYGIDTVRESCEDPLIGKYVRNFIFKEVVPTIKLPKTEMEFFANSVLERYENPFVRHELMSIALNSTTKYVTRILPTVLDYYKEFKKIPKISVFSFAALCVFYKGKRCDKDIALNDNVEYLEMWKNLWNKVDGSKNSIQSFADELLSRKEIWGLDLNTLGNFNALVVNDIYSILSNGMGKAVTQLLDDYE